MGKQKKSKFWIIIGKAALIIGILAGLVAIWQAFISKENPIQTSGNNSPIIVTDDGDVKVNFNEQKNNGVRSDSLKNVPK